MCQEEAGERGTVEALKGKRQTGLLGQAVKTSPFHGGNTGSIPVGVIYTPMWLNWQSS